MQARRRLLRGALAAAAALLAGCATLVPAVDRPSDAARVRGGGTADVVQRQPAPGSCHARGSGRFTLPDPRCTPGAVSPAVSQANIHATICRAGYTRRVRPPAWVTQREKRASMAAYGDSGSPRRYEYDHLIPLELGGAANDPHNLWPEPGASPNPKDALEDSLRARVCEHRVGLAVAQSELARNWVAVYRRTLAARSG